MEKRLTVKIMMALMVAGLVFSVSCAKKTVTPGQGESQQVQADDAAAREAAAAAEAAEKAARQKAIEEARLKEEALKEEAMNKVAAAKQRFVNQDIHFEFDSDELSPMSRLLLKDKAEWLRENPRVTVTIEGHCDERGTTEYNLALGERRAVAVQKFFVNLGISDSRMTTVSWGEERPLDPAHNETAWAKNRRAHCVVD